MSQLGKELDKFVNAYLSANKNARDAEYSNARENYYNALASDIGIQPDQLSGLNNKLSDYRKNFGSKSAGEADGEAGGVSTPNAEGAWWTPERQKFAADYLVKNAGLSNYGAAGLVARWSGIESRGGPNDFNSKGGGKGAIGVGQWRGSRQGGLTTKSTFEENLAHAVQDLKHPDQRAAYEQLQAAKSEKDGARGASMYERAEGYDAKTGVDNFTAKTPVGSVYKTVFGATEPAGQTKPAVGGREAKSTAPSSAVPLLVGSALPSIPAAKKTAPGISRDFEDEPSDVGNAPPAAIPTSSAGVKDYTPKEIRPKLEAGAAGSPQAALDDPEMYGDNEFAAKGGLIGRSKEYPLHHVVGEAMRHTQNMYGLNAVNGGAIQDPNYSNQVRAFLGNSHAPSPEAMDALLARHSSDKEPIGAAMRGMYAHFANGGDVRAAQEAVAGILQGARQRAMDYGSRAMEASDAGDHPAAIRHLTDAYNLIPDGHSLTAEVNHNGFGRGQFINHDTGAPIQTLAFTPDAIRNASQNFAAGSGFYPHLAYAMQQGQQVKKFEDAGLVDNSGMDTPQDDDRQVSQDAALSNNSAQSSETSPATEEAALPVNRAPAMQANGPSDQDLDREILSSGWKPKVQAPAEPEYATYEPGMNRATRAYVDKINAQLLNEYKFRHDEYKQQVAQELAMQRIDKRQQFSAEQKEKSLSEAQAREARAREERIHNNRMKTNSDYAFQQYNSDILDRYKNATAEDAHSAAMDVLNARWNQEFGARRDTAKERDDVAINDKINHYWDEVRGVRKDTETKRADGSPMTDVSKKAYYDFSGLESEEKRFKNVLYSLMSDNNRTSPDAVIRAAHDMAFKHFKKGEGPQIDDRTGKVKLGGVSLFMNQEQYENLLTLRNNAKAYDKQVADKATAQTQQKAVIAQRKAADKQNKADAESMRPGALSADQQYAIKHGYSADYTPEEVDSAMQRGAI